jgi:hypothetical protein
MRPVSLPFWRPRRGLNSAPQSGIKKTFAMGFSVLYNRSKLAELLHGYELVAWLRDEKQLPTALAPRQISVGGDRISQRVAAADADVQLS